MLNNIYIIVHISWIQKHTCKILTMFMTNRTLIPQWNSVTVTWSVYGLHLVNSADNVAGIQLIILIFCNRIKFHETHKGWV